MRRIIHQVPKLCGFDSELGNAIFGLELPGGTGHEAARALIREFDGYPGDGGVRSFGEQGSGGVCGGRSGGWGGHGALSCYDPQDWNRRFLPANGGCAYIDLDHLELCAPEVRGAHEHLAAWHAMLRIARRALARANAKLPPGQTIRVLVNNSDGSGHSYGSHLSFLVTRRAWDNLFDRRLHYLLVLAAYQVSSIVFTGQGKVGSENGAPAVAFQLSQRADFFERLVGIQTTYQRPIVNSRDEPLCGRPSEGPQGARLHVIFFDNTLSHAATLLKVGVMQIILALLEAERVPAGLILDDPLEAVVRWSHDPTLATHARLGSGRRVTAVELQLEFLGEARRFAARGGLDGIVPRAAVILDLWEDTLAKLQARDLAALAPRLDWVLKHELLARARAQRPGLDWNAPQMKQLDLLYASLDPAEGLYWICEQGGLTERLVEEPDIERLMSEPPSDTRAYTRAMLLRRAGPAAVTHVDWDSIHLRLPVRDRFSFPVFRSFDMPDPLALTRAESEAIFRREGLDLDRLLDELEASGDAAPRRLPSILRGRDLDSFER
jgi:proteasome accessory factor A